MLCHVIVPFAFIVLSVPPEVTLPYQQITQHSGKDTLLECMISANPLTTHHWEREGVPIQVYSSLGYYLDECQCHAPNQVGSGTCASDTGSLE